MNMGLRIMLIVFSILFLLIIVHRIRSSCVRIIDLFYWIILSIIFIFMAIFSDSIIKLSRAIGFESPINFVFLVVIFLLLWKNFSMSIKMSIMDERFKDAVEEISILIKKDEHETNKNTFS